MKKTLIIHPKDNSTDFLAPIYESVPNKTVIKGGIEKARLKELMYLHDRIMIMGHGSPQGLCTVGAFKGLDSVIVDDSMVKILKGKRNSVFIWCYADAFVKKHDLKGLYTGMFISELSEAYDCDVEGVNSSDVNESNTSFSALLSKCIENDTPSIFNDITNGYGNIAKTNKIALYNFSRIRMSQ